MCCVYSHITLHPQVDAFRGEVDHHRLLQDCPAGQELYKSLIGPAESLIPKGSRLVIIPSKILSLVSFESLIVPGPHPHSCIHHPAPHTSPPLPSPPPPSPPLPQP